VFVTGEVCYAHDRRLIEGYFQVPVADGYGSRDAGFIAHQCPEGGMHIMAENLVVEVIREGGAGAVADAGDAGEIVITHLDAWAMPFIRYRTGDTGRLLPGRCRCGRGLPLMDVVQGRVTDFLRLPDGNVRHALSIIYPLREMPGIRRFRVTQHKDYSVTIDIVADQGVIPTLVSTVTDRVRPVLGREIPVEVRAADAIPETDSGKFRYVISHAPR
jgi:phenylacetate-CoA ligase